MFYQWEQHPNLDRRHRPRTRNGCLTCRLGVRTKKVRLRLQQKPQQQQLENELPARPDCATENAEASVPSTSDGTIPAPEGLSDDDPSFNRMFSYASFMWDDSSPTGLSPGWDTLDLTSSQDLMPWSDTSLSIPSMPITYSNPMANTEAVLDRQQRLTAITSPTVAIGWSETQLADYFARSAAPPILATVETSARWFWMRKQLTSMTSTSRMVKFGVIAFVALELESAGTLEPATYTQYYRTAKERLEDCLKDIRHLLTKDVSKAHANLREGFHALEMVDIESLSVTERRLLSWLRLLDARAVSAGGEGLFLTEGGSAVNTDLHSPDSSIAEVDSGLDDAEAALEDFIMRPAFQFFQKVQLFMGRISKIDPWHRRRGTVEDETEVMAISAAITQDIKSLWQQRPPLMDYAVAGKLATLLSPSLAETITRTMRVYHANYYASFIHLHRVAYKNLPRTTDVVDAMNEIRQVTKMILESPWTSSPQENPVIGTPNASTTILPSLPVNMLWPLLMLGVEVEEPEERTWVISCIKGTENVASNAGITANVLQEVIRRQDETKQRVDIRKVMHETFDRAFAIV
ncbi:hypothetical protein PENSUB_3890 [Penicillium subrubescens]|uniref:Uncharacterized protein n=1 Tax=Penicillium subrubescens TaxID=1316194 RepID=A0A1Q5UDM6_9EURO|nr:hypothetical protein PENSUB_3890 [Penicillium subrubescens]